MIKVTVKNKLSQGQTHGATFDTLEQANQWIVECESVKAWGDFYDEHTNDLDEVVPAKEKEYEIVIEDITFEVEQEQINAEALAYLASTDWMAIRAAEGGTPMPEEVRIARQAARERVVR